MSSSRRGLKNPWNTFLGNCNVVDSYLNEVDKNTKGDKRLKRQPWSLKWALPHFINVFLRSASMPILACNPISGLLIITGLFVAKVEFIFGFQPWAEITNGAATFNGLLFGAITTSVFPGFVGMENVPFHIWIIIPLGAIASVMLSGALSRAFRPFHLPYLALPFSIMCSIVFVAMQTQFEFPEVEIKHEEVLHEVNVLNTTEIDWIQVGEGIFLSIGQVYGVKCYITSALIAVAVFIFSPVLLFFVLLGASIGTLTGVGLVPIEHIQSVYDGGFGFNSILSCGFIGATYFICGIKPTILGAFNALIAVFVQVALSQQFVIPVFALPFSITSIFFSLLRSPGLIQSDGAGGYPEGNFFLWESRAKAEMEALERERKPC
ncbi:SLC14A [Lepeophtheirus salmonis]|uniref:SLC14A n=1 Tax=Lepeophtheirus salmonis TaxID=72036 RepID=A0A7R8HAA8_LEPSM|nr:SLC14A [Lepeophtheirus salmonis]CAF2973018.1 SLC14A [Lepeophtheirus salmonis]